MRASVLIPTRNPGPAIADVLEAVFGQQTAFDFEVVIVDSASRESDAALMRSFGVAFYQIGASEFGHGRTRNLLATRSRGEILVFMSQDAMPASSTWLETLVAPLSDPSVAGVYARQIPRQDADAYIRFFLHDTYGPTPTRRRLGGRERLRINDMFFSNVSSALRRSVWERIPFRDDVIMSEDQYWANDVLRAGHELVYEPAAQVYHSHNYSLATLFRRNRLSGRSLHGLIADSPAAVARRGLGYIAREMAYLAHLGRLDMVPYMFAYEAVKSLGFALGSVEGHRQIETLR